MHCSNYWTLLLTTWPMGLLLSLPFTSCTPLLPASVCLTCWHPALLTFSAGHNNRNHNHHHINGQSSRQLQCGQPVTNGSASLKFDSPQTLSRLAKSLFAYEELEIARSDPCLNCQTVYLVLDINCQVMLYLTYLLSTQCILRHS